MIQSILIGTLLIIALAYVGRLAYQSFTSTTCSSGCGGCNAVDVNSILESFEKKKAKG